ncbi:F0F1 ATP synthase subunit gamma [Sphaerobacter thermophilus]|uniref:ATP synthase gamma chain n=1 Tax=Sphaerobacter thermophilus (strain ATCC 49802 / DSM 20745 / KCCM 41009 / NCIMB 13125 / S 6022) TaxID=479434 RepID=D1C3P0_SPHTD|nr:F0F1 ATP synthase subunit gamma [Sphaerobacter thermophilus]ACZ38857.1 ATP synthase F1, gamma subunit [Sphaerobacter thermophilus DSM 20745]PZN68349.1 MAG: ATP synthase F1 subunit gamma [Sphaerobacter thermophilus]
MPTPREIRRRIRSVRNTAQITRAMEMVAASKMRRAQQHVLATRPYAERIRAMIGDLAAMGDAEEQARYPLLAKRPIQRSQIILITSDRGLAGAFNTNVIRRAIQFMTDERPESLENIDVVTIGRKGRDFLTRYGRPLVASFTDVGDYPTLESIRPVVRIATDDFVAGKVDAVYVVYTRFINTLRQVPEVLQVLPIEAPPGTDEVTDYIFEPSPEAVLEALLPRFVEVQIYQALLESIASEQSARMVAMRNATDNARELVSELTLTYNKARQAQITREVTEIAAGAAALG